MKGSTLSSMESIGKISTMNFHLRSLLKTIFQKCIFLYFLSQVPKLFLDFQKALKDWAHFHFNGGSNNGRRFWTSSRVFNQTHYLSASKLHPIENSIFKFSNVQEFENEGMIFHFYGIWKFLRRLTKRETI